MRAWHGVLAVVLAGTAVPVNALLPDRKTIDELLAGLGADNQYDSAKGIDWSVLPGPFYTPELKVGLGMAVAGLYRVDPLDTTTQNSSISFSGFVSTSGALGLGFKNYTFFTDDKWRLFVEGNVNKIPTGFWGIGYDAAQGDEQKYTNNSLRVHPMLLRELTDNWYAGVGWDFSAMSASVDDPHPGDNFSRYGAQTSPVASGMAFSASYDTRTLSPVRSTGNTSARNIPGLIRRWAQTAISAQPNCNTTITIP